MQCQIMLRCWPCANWPWWGGEQWEAWQWDRWLPELTAGGPWLVAHDPWPRQLSSVCQRGGRGVGQGGEAKGSAGFSLQMNDSQKRNFALSILLTFFTVAHVHGMRVRVCVCKRESVCVVFFCISNSNWIG